MGEGHHWEVPPTGGALGWRLSTIFETFGDLNSGSMGRLLSCFQQLGALNPPLQFACEGARGFPDIV